MDLALNNQLKVDMPLKIKKETYQIRTKEENTPWLNQGTIEKNIELENPRIWWHIWIDV